MSKLSCQVCFNPYNAEDHRPLLLPACGHSFCASCLGCLYGQGNTRCPKCRKDGAVKSISSLPVNYSLLEIVEDRACQADASAELTSTIPKATGASNHQEPTSGPFRDFLSKNSNPFGAMEASTHHSLMPFSTQFTHPFGAASGTSTFRALGCSHQLRPQVIPASYPGFTHSCSFNPRLLSDLQGLRHCPPSTSPAASQHDARTAFKNSLALALSHRCNTTSLLEKEQQDEVDFQLAVHLTFCKDSNHDLDLHHRCSSWRMQNL